MDTSESTRARLTGGLAHVAAPLAIGGAVYLAHRSPKLMGWVWADALGLGESGRALRGALRAAWPSPPELVRFVLPDALFVYALSYLLARFARGRTERALMMLFPLAFGPGAELLQAVGALRGTFDPLDLFATTLALLLGALVGRPRSPASGVTPTTERPARAQLL